MAIKERKQITGTEAQIKGYAGHNGVLAYATDTKHLHVLSGTAGTTTKLANMSDIPAPVDISGKADKTYVDTELAKKQTKGDYATNTALTEGLAGKADKTYVDTELAKKQTKGDYATNTALTEGLAGKANKAHTHTVSQITDMSNVVLSVNNITPSSGGNVNLGLHAVATSGNYNDLSNKPTIPVNPANRVTLAGSSGSNRYHVWSNGFIEQWGLLNGPGTTGGTVTFPKRFSNTDYIFVVTPNEAKAQGDTFVWYTENKTTSSITSAIQATGTSAPKQSWYAAGF